MPPASRPVLPWCGHDAIRSRSALTGHGVWSFSGANTYAARFVAMILFDTPPAPPAPGFQTGWLLVRSSFTLVDATRRDIVLRSLQAEYSVSGLARLYPMSFAAIQKHVSVLEEAGLVTKQRRGREQLVSGNMDAIRDVNVLLDHFEAVWRDRLDRFGEVLADTEHEGAES